MAKILRASGMSKCIGCFTCMMICSGVNHKNHSISHSAIKIRTMGGISGRFSATICLGCKGARACMEACPAGALTERNGGGVIFHKDLCIGCRKCEEACIVGAVHFDADNFEPIICKHCGVCARFCPHECLEMEDV
jgi:Fe-S-cluster-containing dehydrogenase component